MKIIFNTDDKIMLTDIKQKRYKTTIVNELAAFNSLLSTVEIYLTEEDPRRDGHVKKFCVLKSDILGRKPLTIINRASSNNLAFKGAVTRLKTSLEKMVSRSDQD